MDRRRRTAPASPPAHDVETAGTPASRPATASSCRPTCGCRGRRTAAGPVPGDPRDDPVRQGQLAPQRGHRPRHVPGARAGTPCAGSTSAGPARPAASRSTSTREAETLDGFDAVEWLAAQPWCTGAVGMWGISYGGVHLDPGRQAAAAAPAGDRAGPGDRRPLPDRRPLHRRLRHGSASSASTRSARSR